MPAVGTRKRTTDRSTSLYSIQLYNTPLVYPGPSLGSLAPSVRPSWTAYLSLEANHSAIEYPSHSFMTLAASTAPKKALTYSLICSGTLEALQLWLAAHGRPEEGNHLRVIERG